MSVIKNRLRLYYLNFIYKLISHFNPLVDIHNFEMDNNNKYYYIINK
jgi:hypothetical protein